MRGAGKEEERGAPGSCVERQGAAGVRRSSAVRQLFPREALLNCSTRHRGELDASVGLAAPHHRCVCARPSWPRTHPCASRRALISDSPGGPRPPTSNPCAGALRLASVAPPLVAPAGASGGARQLLLADPGRPEPQVEWLRQGPLSEVPGPTAGRMVMNRPRTTWLVAIRPAVGQARGCSRRVRDHSTCGWRGWGPGDQRGHEEEGADRRVQEQRARVVSPRTGRARTGCSPGSRSNGVPGH